MDWFVLCSVNVSFSIPFSNAFLRFVIFLVKVHTSVGLCGSWKYACSYYSYSGTSLLRSPMGLGKIDLNGEVTLWNIMWD